MGALAGVPLAVVGGDRREVELVRALAAAGAQVRVVGLPVAQAAGVERVSSLAQAVAGARAVVAPMAGTDEAGRVAAPLEPGADLRLDEAFMAQLGPRVPLFVGTLKPVVAQAAARHRVRVVELAAVEEIAIANSVPTAEGAVQIAMKRLPVTIHGCAALVIGFGRCGMTLARLLAAMGARVGVAARGAAELARAEAMGLSPWPWPELPLAVAEQDVVFNTVPAPVLGRAVLERTRPDVLVVDIASAPGGTDFAAARDLGRAAVLALGLPGRVAPVTAGRILARYLPGLIRAELDRG
ncbi:MAG TPA: dipicolinate synthase subunit DpsA [Limnochordales bacterium]|nr:dipicolinate synthase subunit DpsA [Limnochordales bacterium]